MADNDFPSGPWTGYYQYRTGERGQQDLQLTFARGRMTGAGQDALGQFLIEGTYDPETKEASWLKSYPDGHAIDYRGFREGPPPGIWGAWRIDGDWSGGFHIWPIGRSGATLEVKQAEVPTPKVRIQEPQRA